MQSLAFVLIPGAGGSAWYWHLVAPRLQERGAEGSRSGPAGPRMTRPVFRSTPILSFRAIGHRHPQRVILVAQSLAGFTLPLVCEKLRVAMLVLVNAMIPKPRRNSG
jgi:hypothetical protein